MAYVVYALCALTSLTCAMLLMRKFFRNRTPFLLCSAICFFFWGINNVILFLDFLVVHNTDLSLYRTMAGLAAMVVLMYGFIWEAS